MGALAAQGKEGQKCETYREESLSGVTDGGDSDWEGTTGGGWPLLWGTLLWGQGGRALTWGSLVGRTLGSEDYCPGGAKKVEGWTPAGGHRWADVVSQRWTRVEDMDGAGAKGGGLTWWALSWGTLTRVGTDTVSFTAAATSEGRTLTWGP